MMILDSGLLFLGHPE